MTQNSLSRLARDIEHLETETESRHESNEKRFDRVENKVTELTAQVKIIVVLLIINGGINVAHFFK